MAQDLPPGPGADLLSRACQSCHGLDTITSEHHDRDGWRAIVGDMINSGASLSDTEADTVADYLGTNFGMGPAPAASATPVPATPATSGAAPADQAPPASGQTPPAQ
jgi:hypothetical protein